MNMRLVIFNGFVITLLLLMTMVNRIDTRKNKKVVIHVPLRKKLEKHTHTVVKHIHHHHKPILVKEEKKIIEEHRPVIKNEHVSHQHHHHHQEHPAETHNGYDESSEEDEEEEHIHHHHNYEHKVHESDEVKLFDSH